MSLISESIIWRFHCTLCSPISERSPLFDPENQKWQRTFWKVPLVNFQLISTLFVVFTVNTFWAIFKLRHRKKIRKWKIFMKIVNHQRVKSGESSRNFTSKFDFSLHRGINFTASRFFGFLWEGHFGRLLERTFVAQTWKLGLSRVTWSSTKYFLCTLLDYNQL